MKTFTLLAALVSVAFASPVPDGPAGGHGHGAAPAPAQAPTSGHGHGGAPAQAPKTSVTSVKARFNPNNKRVRVNYGTYKLPAYNAPAAPHGGGMAMPGMEHEGGMLDATNKNAPLPCTDCTIKHAQAFLTGPDGKNSNIQQGAWLHHLTLAVVGPGRSDVACPGGTKRIPLGMERILAVHNDRNETFYGVTGTDKLGFYLGKDDKFDLELMLKNDVNVEKQVTFAIEYEYVQGKPAGWGDVKGIWMDVAPCSAHMSDIDPPKGQRKFTLEGPEWTSTINGRLLNTVGHMHDGGVSVQILVNNKAVCTSNAEYDVSPDYQPSAETIKLGAVKSQHISRYTPCIAIGDIKKGDKLKLTASYDFDKYKPLENKLGNISHVMGVALVLVEVKK
jgi:hypothetical protein